MQRQVGRLALAPPTQVTLPLKEHEALTKHRRVRGTLDTLLHKIETARGKTTFIKCRCECPLLPVANWAEHERKCLNCALSQEDENSSLLVYSSSSKEREGNHH